MNINNFFHVSCVIAFGSFSGAQAQPACAVPCDYQDAGPVDYCIYPSTGCPPNYHPQNGCCCYDYSPIIVDIDGDGIRLTDAANGVRFDFSGVGRTIQVAWTARGADDAWLVLDRNRNGQIDSAAEMFGNVTPQPPSPTPNGYLALAEFDKVTNGGNRDNVIDPNDSVYRALRLWRDDNHDGVTEPEELHTLPPLASEELISNIDRLGVPINMVMSSGIDPG